MIIGLSGYAGAGKNAVADILVSEFGFTQMAFADALKESIVALDPLVSTERGVERLSEVVSRETMDVAKNKYPSVRKSLQDYGVTMRDLVDKEVWVKALHAKVLDMGASKVCITDLRFENELKYLMEQNGAVVKVMRPNNPLSIGTLHVSEQMVVDTPYVLENNGSLRDLSHKVVSLFQEWNFGKGYQKFYTANGRAACKSCNRWKNTSDFPGDNRMLAGISSKCRVCTNDNAKNKPSRTHHTRRIEYQKLDKGLLFDKSRESLLASYGLTLEEYNHMLVTQNYRCAICSKKETRVHQLSGKEYSLTIDHDHNTGRVRGLLCTKCNKGLGTFGDSPDLMKRAVRYLEADA